MSTFNRITVVDPELSELGGCMLLLACPQSMTSHRLSLGAGVGRGVSHQTNCWFRHSQLCFSALLVWLFVS